MRLDSLTGLRFVAAVLVFGHHAGTYTGMYEEGTYNALFPGMVGVSFFFLLSGFLLAWSYRPGGSAKDFWQRRFARVYPAYFVAWALVAASNVVMGDGFGWRDALALTLTQAWVPSEPVYFAVSAVFWSLSAEAFFYLIFPFIINPLARLTEPSRLAGMGVIVLVVFGIAAIAHPLVSGSAAHWFLYFFPPTRALEFVLGILLALQLKNGKAPILPLSAASALAIVAYGLSGFTPGSFMRVAVMLVPFALLIASAANADAKALSSPFRGKVLVRLGEWSYAFYLLHATVIGGYLTIVERVLSIQRDAMGALLTTVHLLVALVLSVVAAGLLYQFVEKPLNDKLRPKSKDQVSASEPSAN